ncbi:hypothetical protein JCGZ_19143 [Jatropha curcas]|uniref:Uncharacterized protein n=1 Tax=Jatropha curcas TaxID=180498 RepID=A0A067K068_JATCU|nr:hypothetical protein JCGZ_19143 [Jatropha curcas]
MAHFIHRSHFWIKDQALGFPSSIFEQIIKEITKGCEGNLGSTKQGFLHLCGMRATAVACAASLWLMPQVPRNFSSYSINVRIQ